ncbi:MAG: hypothetical protein ING08_14755 [Roseomonas sp.]|nr:hypothetical protein [Roseomonas sp.]MCA3381489.1 hypothetical protein [Roseomonas sp.]
MKLRSFRTIAPLLLLAGCAGAGAGPASERGFFTGIGAAVSGEDVRGAERLENAAALQERAAQMAVERNTAAQAEAARSGAAVRASEARLARLQADLAQQRATLERLRAERAQNPTTAAEAARLQSELDALERDRRAAAARAGGPSADQVQSIERRAGELDAALQRFGRI